MSKTGLQRSSLSMSNGVALNICIHVLNKYKDAANEVEHGLKIAGLKYLKEANKETVQKINDLTLSIKEMQVKEHSMKLHPEPLIVDNYQGRGPDDAANRISVTTDEAIERLIHVLRNKPDNITKLFVNGKILGRNTGHANLAHFITECLFGSCMTVNDECLLLLLINKVLEAEGKCMELEHFNANYELFSGSLLSAYLSNANAGNAFIGAIKPFIVFITQNPTASMEPNNETNKIVNRHSIPLNGAEKSMTQSQIFRQQYLERSTASLLNEILSRSYLIPFALKWYSKKMYNLQLAMYQAADSSSSNNNHLVSPSIRAVVSQVIFASYISNQLVKSNNVTFMTGQYIGKMTTRNNLNVLARELNKYVEMPDQIPASLDAEYNLSTKLKELFDEVEKMDDIEKYFSGILENDQSDAQLKMLISNVEMRTLFKDLLVYANNGFEGSQIRTRIQQIQKLSMMESGAPTQLIEINAMPKPIMKMDSYKVDASAQAQEPLPDDMVLPLKECKDFLKRLFTEFNRTECSMSSTDLKSFLRSLYSRMNSDNSIVGTLIEQVFVYLDSLPVHFTEDNYRRLANQMLDDIKQEKRDMRLQIKKSRRQLRCLKDNLTLLEIKHQRLADNQSLNQFYKSKSIEMATLGELVRYLKEFTAKLKLCDCNFGFLLGTCDPCHRCIILKSSVDAVLLKIQEQHQKIDGNNSVTRKGSREIGFISVKKDIMVKLHQYLFQISKMNVEYEMALNLKKRVPGYDDILIKELEIKPKLIPQDRWQRAVEVLQNIGRYSAPDDMLQCILDTWKVFSEIYASKFESLGADDYLPIMCYIIYAAKVSNILSIVQYINLYASIDYTCEQPFMMFLGSLCALVDIVGIKWTASKTNFRRTTWGYP